MQAQSYYGRTVRCLSTAGGALNSDGELGVHWVMQRHCGTEAKPPPADRSHFDPRCNLDGLVDPPFLPR